MNNYKLKYNVRIGYLDFYFESADSADAFMRLAASAISEDDKSNHIELIAVVELDKESEDVK
jgi:hypothetical protein